MSVWYSTNVAKQTKKQVNRISGVVAYCRVSTEEQAQSGLGLAAQEAEIRTECEHRGLPLLAVYKDAGASGKDLGRPALTAALDDMKAGLGSVLMVAKLDRLTRSVHDASGLMQRAEKGGWGLVALNTPVDTTTPAGAAMAQVMSVFAELERKMIGERTRAALAVKRAQGTRLGRPQQLTPEIVERIINDRSEGVSWSAIARSLNEEAVPTAQGGKAWYPATVRKVALAATTHSVGAPD
jgi:DNA invertase Pin-like site-specific DNA recombinase